MDVSADTWAVVLATGLGPIFAVGITLWFTHRKETRGALYDRRLGVFRTLMSTRRVAINPDHVNALNLIEVDFYRCPGVEAAWKDYKAHLFRRDVDEDEIWRDDKEKLLSKLLFEIAKVLGLEIPAIDLFKGGYAPGGWSHRDELQTGTLEFFRELREGKNVLPLWICGPPDLWGGRQEDLSQPSDGATTSRESQAPHLFKGEDGRP